MISIEKSGKTAEEAIRAGLLELNCTISDVTTEVLDAGSPGLFGLFGRLARVRITKKEDKDFDEQFDLSMPKMTLDTPKAEKPKQPKPAPKKSTPKVEEAPDEAAKEAVKPEAPKAEASEKPDVVDKPAQEEKSSEKPVEKPAEKLKRENRPPKKDKPNREPKENKEPKEEKETPFVPSSYEDFPFVEKEKLSELGQKCYDFLANTTEKMSVPVEIRVKEEEGAIRVQMVGDTLGILIGRRGDTLDALQYLTSLYVNKGRSDYTRISLDTEHYRAKREEALTKLAFRMAAKAKKTGRRVALEPMNPYERRILHSALQNDQYVTTHSEGEEPYRRVIITLK